MSNIPVLKTQAPNDSPTTVLDQTYPNVYFVCEMLVIPFSRSYPSLKSTSPHDI